MKLASWNVNGIRAAARNGFLQWLDRESPDVVGLQETKALPEQLEEQVLNPKGYKSIWHSAVDKGYSGVGFYYKTEPLDVKIGIGVPQIDDEGRVLTLDFKNFFLVTAYFPNSGRDHSRLPYKLDFCREIFRFLKGLESKKPFLICGDFNIAHKEIDLANPKTNQKNAGFLPEERAWMDDFINSGYIDVYRQFYQRSGDYTWWSYRPGVREKNIGWRLDYFCGSKDIKPRLIDMTHQTDVMGSDHCPIVLELKN